MRSSSGFPTDLHYTWICQHIQRLQILNYRKNKTVTLKASRWIRPGNVEFYSLVQILAEETLRRGEDGSFESVPPHQLCKLAFGLAQNMRSDCPWDELLQLLADGLMHNRDEVFAGPCLANQAIRSLGLSLPLPWTCCKSMTAVMESAA